MRLDEFDYDLPSERIAHEPPARRGDSRLLVLDRRTGERTDSSFRELSRWLARGDLLVRNDTRVFPARLRGRRASGGPVELLLVRAVPETARDWLCLVRPGKRLRPGERAELGSGVFAEWLDETGGDGLRRVRFHGTTDVLRLAEEIGEVPLPPYLKRAAASADRERYQTVYAQRTGAAAAPTAGLHFTAEHFTELEDRGVQVREVTLHVGPGTFLPIRDDDLDRHRMHTEWVDVPEATATAVGRTKAAGGRVVAIGTTVVRALEGRSRSGRLEAGEGDVDLFLRPGDRFHTVDALITNFHLPKSTLLLLVCAFAGRDAVLEAYAHAVREGYRFFSYGDAMLIV